MAVQIDKMRKDDPSTFKGIVDTAVRVKRIAPKKEEGKESPEFDHNYQEEEKAALKTYQNVYKKSLGKYSVGLDRTLTDLNELTAPMTAYFEKVMVMSKDEQEKKNRLAFLFLLNKLFLFFADFEKISL
jgi:glycyl-tRNA synthetase beta subunit